MLLHSGRGMSRFGVPLLRRQRPRKLWMRGCELTEIVKRVATVVDLPDDALACAAVGRHLGFLDDVRVATESNQLWGELDARRVVYRCHCSRIKEEVIDWDTGERLSRSVQYSGGTLTYAPADQREAKKEMLHRIVAKAADAAILADRRARPKAKARR